MNAFERAPQGKKMLTLVGIYVCIVFAVMQSSGLSIILPMAAGEFDAISGTDEAMKVYSLAASLSGPVSIVLMPLWGYIGARSPHVKTTLMAASVLIGGMAVLVRSFATNIWVVILTGAIYGVVSAGVYVLGFVIVRDLFPGSKAGIYLGLIATMQAFGSLVSPVLTGFVVGTLGWRWGCHIIWPFLIIGAVMVLLGVRITKEEGLELANRSGNIDLAGIICVALFLGPLICGISMGRSVIPFGTPLSYAVFAVSLVALIALIAVVRKKGAAAVIPAPALADRNTVCLALSNFCMNFANMFVFFFLPTYILMVMQPSQFGLAPAAWSGIIIGSLAVFGLFLGPVFGKMIAKSGNARTVSLFGIISRSIVLIFLLVFLSPGMNIFLLVAVFLVFGGIYSVSGTTAYTTGVNIMVPAKMRQQSNAVVQVGQNFGATPATAIGGILIATYGVAGGMPIAFTIALIACIACIIPTMLLKKSASESDAS
jgi:MFS family permease